MPEQSPDRKTVPGIEGKAAYQFLPIECPNCGFQGKVKIERLDQTFHCKQCNQTFHVTRDGTIPGERPPDAPSMVEVPPMRDEPTRLEQAFVGLPPAAKWGVLGALVLLLALGLVYLFQPAEPLPGELEARVNLACKSLAAGDWKTLKRLAKKGTSGDLGKWYDLVRPDDWSDVADETQVTIKLEGKAQKLKGYEGTHAMVDKVLQFSITAAGNARPLNVSLVFSEDKESQWWLDGQQTLKEYRPAKGGKGKAASDEEDAEDASEE